MKRVLALSLMCLLGSCATTNSKDSSSVSQTKLNSSGYDEKYIASVERQANQRGVTVKWINPPLAPKRKKHVY